MALGWAGPLTRASARRRTKPPVWKPSRRPCQRSASWPRRETPTALLGALLDTRHGCREGPEDRRRVVRQSRRQGRPCRHAQPRRDVRAAAWRRTKKAADCPDGRRQGPRRRDALGLLYDTGLGVAEDDKKAAERYQKAADKGHSVAMNDLARMYHAGRGVAKSDEKPSSGISRPPRRATPTRWYAWPSCTKPAATSRRTKKAAEWYQKAAEGESPAAMNDLAFMLSNRPRGGKGREESRRAVPEGRR